MKKFIICLILVLVSSCYSHKVRDEDKISNLDSVKVYLYECIVDYSNYDNIFNDIRIEANVSIDSTKKSLNDQNISIDSLFWSERDLGRVAKDSFMELLNLCEYPQTFIPKDFKIKILDTLYYIDSENRRFEIYPYETAVYGSAKNRLGEEYQTFLEVKNFKYSRLNNNKTLFLVKHHYFSNTYPKWWTDIRFNISNSSVIKQQGMRKQDFHPERVRYIPFAYNDVDYYLILDQELFNN